MKPIHKFFSIFTLLAILAFAFATPARAFDGRSGDKIVINSDEVVDDDLYLAGTEIVMDGTVNGDLLAIGRIITINGTVTGDVIAAGEVVVINGIVVDDARIAGAALQIGSNANISGDLVAMSASLETKENSIVSGDLLVGSGQVLLAGDVAGDVLAGTDALELAGNFGGNVQAYVDMAEDTASSPPIRMFMTDIPITLPEVRPGLTIAREAVIQGNLAYPSTLDLDIPEGVVGGKIERTIPEMDDEEVEYQPTPAQKVGTWALNIVRAIVTLILFGLLLGWLFPMFMKATSEKINVQPWTSLGWGAIAWGAFFFLLFAIVLVMILGGIIFGFLTLGGVSGTIIWLGLLALLGFTVLFVLVTSYLTKVVVGNTIGKWILSKTNAALAEHKFWPMIIGVVVLVFVIEIFRFPLLPLGLFGWLINFAVILFGLGALWLWGREKFAQQPAAAHQ